MRIGYARVSTADQNLDAQIDELEKAKCEMVYTEIASGASRARAQLEDMIESLCPGDVVVVTRLDRIARSMLDFHRILFAIHEVGALFSSLSENFDTSSAAGRLTMNVLASFAEYERAVNLERTREGLAAAKARGRKLGRPRRLAKDQVDQIRRLVEEGESISKIARLFEVSRSTVRRALQ